MELLQSHLTEIFILIFLAITFIQSGLDKVIDWKRNLGWLRGHFEKTFLNNQVPLLLGVITFLEVVTGFLSALSVVLILLNISSVVPLLSVSLAAITLLMLFFGQRVAKEYAGAFTLTGYFLITLLGVYILSH